MKLVKYKPEKIISNKERLRELALEINKSYQEMCKAEDAFNEQLGFTLKKALQFGIALSKAKTLVKQGEWEKWLDKNCPDIGIRTAQKYRKLAYMMHKRQKLLDGKNAKAIASGEEPNTNHDSLLDFRTLRQAYIAFGIIPEPKEDEDKPKENKAPVDPNVEVKRLVKRLAQLLNKLGQPEADALKPLRKWSEWLD
jgi:hypothetical protein